MDSLTAVEAAAGMSNALQDPTTAQLVISHVSTTFMAAAMVLDQVVQVILSALMAVPYADHIFGAWAAFSRSEVVCALRDLARQGNVLDMLASAWHHATAALWGPRNVFQLANGLKMLPAALAIIYVSAHGSLRRPPSAAPRKPKRSAKGTDRGSKANEPMLEILGPWDAILMPVCASLLLIGLYYAIRQWGSELINRVLRYYMGIMGVYSQTVFFAHALAVIASFVFPTFSRDRQGTLWKAVDDDPDAPDAASRKQGWQPTRKTDGPPHHQPTNPGSAVWWRSVGSAGSQTLWKLRRYLLGEWGVVCTLRATGKPETFWARGVDFLAAVLAVLVSAAYALTSSRWLSNVMSVGFCYGSLLVVSPTSFGIGSSLLAALFVYDVVMVFYTPYMIAVATQLEAPIKLSFKSSVGTNILGLGDIILPGGFICLALRFDLYLHWAAKIRSHAVTLSSSVVDGETGERSTWQETKHHAVKAAYVPASGLWGDQVLEALWHVLALVGFSDGASSSSFTITLPTPFNATAFRKSYFWAAMVGYALGMVLTIAAAIIADHGQPALLYLVPCVVFSTFFCAWRRGELALLWGYTEDGSLDKEDVVVRVDENGRQILHPPVEKANGDAKDPNSDARNAERIADAVAENGRRRGGATRHNEKKPLFRLDFFGPENGSFAETDDDDDDNENDPADSDDNRSESDWSLSSVDLSGLDAN